MAKTEAKAAKTEAPVNQEQPANVTQPTAEVAKTEKVYTSDKLTELNAKLAEQRTAVRNAAAGTKDEDDAEMAVWSTRKLIEAEVASLKQQERDRELAETRAKLKQPLDDLLAAHKDNLASIGNESMTIEQKNAINDGFVKLYDQIANVLMGGARKSAPVVKLTEEGKPASNGTAKGSITATIRTLIAPMYASGKTGAEVRKEIIHNHGFNDGTANAAIKKYEEEIGLK